MPRTASLPALLALAAVSLASCGGASKPAPAPSGSTGPPGAGALSAEVKSAATGDIPDTQHFLVFTDKAAGYTIKYPEGWAQTGSAQNVSIRDKNNIVHVLVASGAQPTPKAVTAVLAKERTRTPSLRVGAPKPVALPAGRALKVTYSTESAPNPVTGKRVKLTVDRYVVAHAGRVATIDLGTPVGVDNVDAYRMIAQSFRWR